MSLSIMVKLTCETCGFAWTAVELPGSRFSPPELVPEDCPRCSGELVDEPSDDGEFVAAAQPLPHVEIRAEDFNRTPNAPAERVF